MATKYGSFTVQELGSNGRDFLMAIDVWAFGDGNLDEITIRLIDTTETHNQKDIWRGSLEELVNRLEGTRWADKAAVAP